MNYHKLNKNLLSVALAGLTTTFTMAQGAAPTVDDASLHRLASRSVGITTTQTGELLAMAPDFEAMFDEKGMRFDPLFGSSSPARPLRLVTHSVRRGEQVVRAFGSAHPATAGHDRLEYSRGAGISERYDVTERGIELSYEFRRQLHGTGDLIVRTRVDTEHRATSGTSSDGLKFWTDGVGGVSVGAVTGIDAEGHSVRGSIRWDGTWLDLVLPAGFVDGAAYPLVLDPLIGAEIIGDSGAFDSMDADVAFDTSNSNYLVVFSRQFGSDDTRLRAQRFSPAGVSIGPVIAIAGNGSQVCSHPAVGNSNPFDRFVVAWQQSNSTFGPYDILAMPIEADTGATGAVITIAATAANEISPDVSGERAELVSTARDEVLIVWNEQGGGIRASEVDIDPPGSAFAGPPVSITIASSARKPAVSKSGGEAGRHAFVWEEGPNDVRIALFSRELTLLQSSIVADGNGFDPDVDGDGDTFMVAFDRPESGSADVPPRDVRCRTYEWTGSGLAPAGFAQPIASTPNVDETDPAVAFLGSKFMVAWSHEESQLFEYSARVRAFAPNGCTVCSDLERFGRTDQRVSQIEIASRWAAGSTSDQALMTWGEFEITPSFRGEILVQRYDARSGSGGLVTNIAANCGGGGIASISGTFQFANAVQIQLAGADPLALNTALHVGSSASLIAPCSPCSVLDPFATVSLPLVGGTASVPLNIGCSPVLLGQALRFQFVSAITATPTCLNLPVGLSNIIEATLEY